MIRVYSVLVTKCTVRVARKMSLLFLFFFEALRLPSESSFLFLFTILGPVHSVYCGQQSGISSLIFLQSFPEQIQILQRFLMEQQGVSICRAIDVFTRVCNRLFFVLAEASATDIQDMAQHFFQFQQRISFSFLREYSKRGILQ